MSATERDREVAQRITGCLPYRARVESDWDFSYCTTHDIGGNPRWDECRWAPVAEALAAERERARAPFLALAEKHRRWAVMNATSPTAWSRPTPTTTSAWRRRRSRPVGTSAPPPRTPEL